MAKYNILRALEFDKLNAATKRRYGSAQGLYDAGWWLQRKFDGVFGKAIIRVDGRHQMLTRTEERILSCAHLLAMIHAAGWKDRDYVVLGELWHPFLPFPTISGDVRRHGPSPHLHFVATDLLPLGMRDHRRYSARHAALVNGFNFTPQFYPVQGHTDCDDVEVQARAWVTRGGYDGAILRDPDADYTIGNASLGQIVKVKPTLSLALRVNTWNETRGEKTGRAVFTIDVVYRGVTTTVGAGMPHSPMDVPLVGAIVEVECLGLTADGKLREPRYKGIRYDVSEPDA